MASDEEGGHSQARQAAYKLPTDEEEQYAIYQTYANIYFLLKKSLDLAQGANGHHAPETEGIQRYHCFRAIGIITGQYPKADART